MDIVTHVSEFAVEDGKIVIVFTEPEERSVPPAAEEHALALQREPRKGDLREVLAPGPAL